MNFKIVALGGLLALLGSGLTLAQDFRSNTWEASLLYKSQSGEKFGAPEGADEANVDFSSDNGWGLTLGYNFDEHLNLAFEFSKNTPKFETRFLDEDGEPRTLSNNASFYSSQLNGTYNLLKGPITPFVTAGLGWTNVDSNISNGNGYCVPDWYWGWYCYSSSYNQNTFSYSAAVGLRADFNTGVFVRASYGRQWLDEKIGKDQPEFDVGKFEIGYRF
jgi:opacity protein-like surface antigen